LDRICKRGENIQHIDEKFNFIMEIRSYRKRFERQRNTLEDNPLQCVSNSSDQVVVVAVVVVVVLCA
jgi:hypothetical protein